MIAVTAATALAATSGQPLPRFLDTVARYLAEYGYWAGTAAQSAREP